MSQITFNSNSFYPPAQSPDEKKKEPYIKMLYMASQNEANGSIKTRKYKKYVRELNKNKPDGIDFKLDKGIKSLQGGTCSAKTITFLHGYLSSKTTVQKYFEDFQSYFYKSTLEDRTLQAAFNCIIITKHEEQRDAESNKIQALLNFHNIKISYVSEAIDAKNKETQDFSNFLKDLPDGAYFIRGLKKADNDKGELYGHSTALIKTNDIFFFYDPNFGLCESNSTSNLCQSIFVMQLCSWRLDSFRLYQCRL